MSSNQSITQLLLKELLAAERRVGYLEAHQDALRNEAAGRARYLETQLQQSEIREAQLKSELKAHLEANPPTKTEAPQEFFQLLLVTAGANKINVIKEIRAITGLGLKEAKDLVDGATPTRGQVILPTCTRERADELVQILESVGATAVRQKIGSP